jgi:hypothetical protein
MAFVIPRWRAGAVRDWEELLITTEGGGRDVNEVTAALLNFLSAVGIAELTEKNLEDAWRRITVFQALFGTYISDPDSGPLFLTRHDVARHVGVEVEVSRELTFEEFCVNIARKPSEQDEGLLPTFIANGRRSALEWSGLIV